MKTKKIILIAVAVVVVAGAGIWFFAGSPAKHKVTYATANAGFRYHRQDLRRLQLGSNQRTVDCRNGPCHIAK